MSGGARRTETPMDSLPPIEVYLYGQCGTSAVEMSPEGRKYATDPAWAEARAVCPGCPVVQVCGQWAMANEDATRLSVWAGLDPDQWAALRSGRRVPNRRPAEKKQAAQVVAAEPEQLVLDVEAVAA